MNRIRKLKGERAEFLAKAKAIAKKASDEDRKLTAEEKTEVDSLKARIEEHDEEIKTLEAIVELERSAPAQVIEEVEPPPATPPAQAATPHVTVHQRILDDPYRGFRSHEEHGLGEFLHAVIQAGRQERNDPFINGRRETRLIGLQAAAGSDEQHGESQQYGGFTVPIGFTGRLLMLEMEADPTAGVTTIPMATPHLQIPARVDKNHTSSVAGGISVSWRPQTTSITSSRMTMEQIMLTAYTLGGIAYVAEELLADSAISFAALLEAGFRDAVADAIIRARLTGTGSGEPLGVVNSPCLVSVSTASQTTGTIVAANIIGMRERCWRYSRAVWLANHDHYEQLTSVHVAGTNSDSFLFNPARGIDVPDTLLGRPIIFTEYCNSVTPGTVGDLLLCVWSEYLVGNLQGMQTAESMHVRFENNERAFRVTMRQAGAPWWRSALTPVNSSDTLSPFVGLQTRTT